MSKPSSSTRLFAHNVNKFIWQFPDLKYENCQIICTVCDITLLAFKKSLCVRHVNSATHKLKKSDKRPDKEFVFDLISMLSVCNIPFYIADRGLLRQFFDKHSPSWRFPSRSKLERNLPTVRQRLEDDIKSQIQNKNLWLAVDETTDVKKHFVANVIVRTLDPFAPSPPYLLATKRLEECTSKAFMLLILNALEKFQVSTNQVLLFVSRDTGVMLSTGLSLKNACPNLLHITCVLQTLHRTVDIIREFYPDVDALILHTKAVFLRSAERTRKFYEQCPGIIEPPHLIPTRSGTWLDVAFYYLQNFENIKSLVLQFDPEEETPISESQIKFLDTQVKEDLKTIHTNYTPLADAINKLQNTSMSLSESLQAIDEVQKVLQTANDPIGISVRERFEIEIGKNQDLVKLRHICINSDDKDHLRDNFNYANITSLDAQRSISLYKGIFSPQRTMLTETSSETHAMMQMFSRANPDFH